MMREYFVRVYCLFFLPPFLLCAERWYHIQTIIKQFNYRNLNLTF